MRVMLKGKIVSERPKHELDVERKRYVVIELEESRKTIGDNYSIWKVFLGKKQGAKLYKKFDTYLDSTIIVQGEAFNWFGTAPSVYANDLMIVNDRTGKVCR